MPQGDDTRVQADAQGRAGRAGFRPGQAAFLRRLLVASDQGPAQRGPVRPRQSRQEFEQRLLGDLAASALHAREAGEPPARAEAQRLGLEGPVVGEAPARAQARRARGAFRGRHRLSAGAAGRGFRHHAGPARSPERERERGKGRRAAGGSGYADQQSEITADIPPAPLAQHTHAAPRAGLPEGQPATARIYSPADWQPFRPIATSPPRGGPSWPEKRAWYKPACSLRRGAVRLRERLAVSLAAGR